MSVETKAFRWLIRAVHAISVLQSRSSLGKIAVPHLVGLLGQAYAVKFTTATRVEKA
jgi:hypothetical protein